MRKILYECFELLPLEIIILLHFIQHNNITKLITLNILLNDILWTYYSINFFISLFILQPQWIFIRIYILDILKMYYLLFQFKLLSFSRYLIKDRTD